MKHASAALLVETGVLESVFESTAEGIFVVDRGGRITGCNAAAEKLLGIARERAVGVAYEQLFPPERRHEARGLLLGTTPGRTRRITGVALRSDGTRLIVEAACSAVRGNDGVPGGFVVVLRDVTERLLVRAAAAAAAFEADASAALSLFAHVLGEVVPVETLTLTSVEGEDTRRVASAGRGADRLTSGEVIPVHGTPLQSVVESRQPLVCAETAAGRLPFDNVLAASGIRSYVVLPLFRSGRVIAALNVGFAAAEVPTAAVVELLVSLTAPIMPIVLNLVALQDRDGAIHRLEQVDALKNEFLALITHEMRTPLAVIAGFADQLQNRWSALAEEAKLECVETIQRNGVNLYRLVEGGLQIARIESGDLGYELVPVDLAEEARQVAADLAGEDGGRIRVSAPPGLPPALCDPQRHRQILANLVSNALKFSPTESPIDVTLSRRGPMLQVAVQDRGPGIAQDDLPKLFRKFSRVGSAEQLLVPGSGLGLYIAKVMVEAQGGEIRVRSRPAAGSTFAYTLPAAAPVAG